MTRPDLEAIRARCEAATPGPWTVQDHDGWYWSVVKADEEDDGWAPDMVFDDGSAGGEYGATCKPHDRDFLVYARTDIPALLAYIDELEICTAHTTSWTIGETEWAQRIATLEHMLSEERENVDTLRAAVEHAEQRFVDEYDARKAAERERDELKARIVVLEAMKP